MSDKRHGFEDLLGAVDSKTPAPGGGFVSSAVGALAAALAGMVVAYSEGKKALVEHAPLHERLRREFATARRLLLQFAEEDARAYSRVSELSKLDEGDPRREAEYLTAVKAAMQAPVATVATCCDLLRLFEDLATRCNQYLLSDLWIAAILAESAARASRCNVLVNLPLLEAATGGPEEGREALARVDELLSDAARRLAAIVGSSADAK